MTTTPGNAPQMPEGDTAEARRASLMSLPPAERLAVFRRVQADLEQPMWGPVAARAATDEERGRLMRLPLIERLAEARRLGVA